MSLNREAARKALMTGTINGRTLTAEERGLAEHLLQQTTRRIAPRKLTAAELAALEARDAEVLASLDRSRARLEAKGVPVPGGGVTYRQAFDAYVRGGLVLLTEAERRMFFAANVERRDQGVAVGTAGAYLVPQEFDASFSIALKALSPIRQLAYVWTSRTGADAPKPQVDDTAQVGGILAENTVATALDLAFTMKTLKAYAYGSGLVKAPWQLVNDVGQPVSDWLPPLLVKRIARFQGIHFTNGTGTGQPEGFITAGTVGVTLATGNSTSFSTGAVGFTAISDLAASVNPAYRADPSCAWLMSDTVWQSIQKLADAQGRPLFPPSAMTEWPPRLLHWPVHIAPEMAAFGANNKIVAFGAWNKHYEIRDVGTVLVAVMRERFADQLQQGYLGYFRSDGRVIDPNAVRLLQCSAA